MFHFSGYFVGAQVDQPRGDEANPHGYYENWRIYRANEHVLSHLDGTWFDAPGNARQIALDAAQRRILEEELAHLLATAGRSPLVLKDPRIGMLMALWWPLLSRVLHPVLVVRHPLEVALSLERRDCTALPVGLAMWELHLTRLLAALDGERVTVIPYRRILEDPGLGERLVGEATAELRPDLRRVVRSTEARFALDPRLRRNRADGPDGTPWLSTAQARLWELLDSLQPGTVLMRTPTWTRRASGTACALAGYEKRRQRASIEREARLEQMGQHVAERERLLAERDRVLVERDRQLDAALARRAELESELHVARERGDETEERLRVAEHWLSEIQRSFSWQATEPLRGFKRRLLARRRWSRM